MAGHVRKRVAEIVRLDPDARRERTAMARQPADQLRNAPLALPRFDVDRGDARDAIDCDVVDGEPRVEAEVGQDEELVGRVPALDVAARVAAIGFYNRLTRSGLPQLQDLRLAGLKAVADLPPLRRAVMRAGMGG